MIEAICEKLYDILQGDSRLYAGGSSFPDGWSGVNRLPGGTAQDGYVNLFEHPLTMHSGRPAIFLGTEAQELEDKCDFETQGGGYTQFRVLTLPLVIVGKSSSQYLARKQRNQLKDNVHAILNDPANFIKDGYWWLAEHTLWKTKISGVDANTSEAFGIYFFEVHYSQSVDGNSQDGDADPFYRDFLRGAEGRA